MTRTLSMLAIALLLSGCADSGSPEAPRAEGETDAPAESVTYTLTDQESPWPGPGETASMAFEVPENATHFVLFFNWRGQQPGGTSSDRGAVLIEPSGHETELMTEDLPLNPYLCANAVCGPAEDRRIERDDPAPGAWAVELRGVYTATASVQVELTATP